MTAHRVRINNPEVGKVITDAKERLGLRWEDIASPLGLHVATARSWRQEPPMWLVQAALLERIMGQSLSEIFEGLSDDQLEDLLDR
jgi:ribosome-binding protein aMBF1 (putative translation factor)